MAELGMACLVAGIEGHRQGLDGSPVSPLRVQQEANPDDYREDDMRACV
jgi:hypothetical protein